MWSARTGVKDVCDKLLQVWNLVESVEQVCGRPSDVELTCITM